MAMYWGQRMFTKEKLGEVNGLIAGWGNTGSELVARGLLLIVFVER